MGFFSDNSPEANAHNEVYNKGSFSHDLIAGAVAYEATKKYNEHRAKGGAVDNHTQAEQLIAGFATAALTHLVETKGRDAYDNFQRERHLKEGNRLFFHDSF
ncbi:hypothetical protein SCLCIDRAFT_140319 [Scleroderma citrinum Foug A]|uniref:Uncharacterized protein n=1 Tax=Scleroderma citrinum Foug A TaxID=1036808 RepID=A0A0C3CW69_9AGAM|nr:hypothetical protein SCLCIDRAFT_140319 [Scleroderma citrinum Foug A]